MTNNNQPNNNSNGGQPNSNQPNDNQPYNNQPNNFQNNNNFSGNQPNNFQFNGIPPKQAWYKQTWAIVLLLIFFFPVGIFLMWKYSNWNKVVKIVVSVIFAIAVIGNMNGNKNKEVATKDTKVETKTEAPKTEEVKADTKVEEPKTEEVKEEPKAEVKTQDKDTYSIGEEVVLRDNILIVNSVTRSQGTEYDKPKDGCEFVIVNVTMKNGGKKDVSYNPFDFKMQNSQGNITDEAFSIVDSGTALNSGDLAAGGSVTGTIVFEQPTGDKGLLLKYKNNIFSSKEVKVKIDQ